MIIPAFRVIVSSPSQYSTVPVSVPVSTVPIPDLGLNLNHQHGQQSLQGQHQQQHHQGPPQGIAIPKRPAVYTNVGGKEHLLKNNLIHTERERAD